MACGSHFILSTGFRVALAFGFVFGLLAAGPQLAHAQTEKTIYSFNVAPDGELPYAGLVRDTKGNFYGATIAGGSSGMGIVFKVSSAGKETILHNFSGGSGGDLPYGTLVRDAKGNLYGTTAKGGASNQGTIYKITASGKETVMHSFGKGSDGAVPFGGMLQDAKGNLYGTTTQGGKSKIGTVFTVSAAGKEKVIFNFNGTNGEVPDDGLIQDAAGNLYGTTIGGGATGAGTVFRVTLAGKGKVLYNFKGGTDGAAPYGGLVMDASGNLYGTTSETVKAGTGTVFKVTPSGKETVLYSFSGGKDGGMPIGTLVLDAKGNLYGTTFSGGLGYGIVFELTAAGTEKILHTFTGGADGSVAWAGMIMDTKGNLYGTTIEGGNSFVGAVFEVVP
jgi:uncharacterized repeat protein (TIGR03803 family)